MDPGQAEAEKHKVRLCAQGVASGPGVFGRLPPLLQELTARSLRLQNRIIYLDRTIRLPAGDLALAPTDAASEFDIQRERIRQAFHAR